MMEKQILIVVARADLALTTIGRMVIVLYAVIHMIVAALLLWKTISAVHWHSMNSVHSRRSAHGASCLSKTPPAPPTTTSNPDPKGGAKLTDAPDRRGIHE